LKDPSEKVERELDAGYRPRLFGKESEIQALLEQHKIPSLALGVIENGQLQQVRVFSADGKSPMQGLYNVASLTKPVVALVVLKLINNGQWTLDGPLSEHYVDRDLSGHPMLNKLSTRHVLSHQTGFPNWRYQAKDKKLTFEFEPGSEYQYSGEGFEYLRKAVEAKFDKPFEEIAKAELFEPVGMSDTHFYWTDEVDQVRYQPEHDDKGNLIELPHHTTVNAADNLITSVEDFSKFMMYVLNGADLESGLYQEMVSQQVAIKSQVGFGLGWQRFDQLQADEASGSEYALQHTGSDSGINALAIMLPNSKRGLLVLSNSDNATKLWTKIVSEHFGEVGNKLMSANLR
jgi:CubicO group peptidase (beta-lactamase class C family)